MRTSTTAAAYRSRPAAGAVRKVRRHEEDDIQKALFQWIDYTITQIPQLSLAFAVPNGGKRNVREAARMKGMGVRAGVPDIMIPCRDGRCSDDSYIGLAIELKSAKGVLSDAQKIWHDRLFCESWHVAVCRSFEEARQEILDYFNPYR